MKQLEEDPWDREIPHKFRPGSVHRGKVTKITNFGVFVQLEDNLEGLLHISEISEKKIENPAEILQVGQDVDVKVIKIDSEERKIGLSLRKVTKQEEAEMEAEKGTRG